MSALASTGAILSSYPERWWIAGGWDVSPSVATNGDAVEWLFVGMDLVQINGSALY